MAARVQTVRGAGAAADAAVLRAPLRGEGPPGRAQRPPPAASARPAPGRPVRRPRATMLPRGRGAACARGCSEDPRAAPLLSCSPAQGAGPSSAITPTFGCQHQGRKSPSHAVSPGNVRFAHAARSAVRAAGRGLPGCAEGQRGASSPAGHGACPTPGGAHARPGPAGEAAQPRPARGASVRCLLRPSPGSPSRCRVRLPEATPLCLKRSSARLGVSGSHALTLPRCGGVAPVTRGQWRETPRLRTAPGRRSRTEARARGPAVNPAARAGRLLRARAPGPSPPCPVDTRLERATCLASARGRWRGPPRTAAPRCG